MEIADFCFCDICALRFNCHKKWSVEDEECEDFINELGQSQDYNDR